MSATGDPMNYLLVTSELPIVSHVTEASPKAYLPWYDLIPDGQCGDGFRRSSEVPAMCGQAVSPLSGALLDAVVRLVRLVNSPSEAPFLARLIIQEIIYRLLRSEQGARLCYIAAQGGHTHEIARAIALIRSQ